MHRFGRIAGMGPSAYWRGTNFVRISIACALVAFWTAVAMAAEKSDCIQGGWQPHTVRQYRGNTLVDIPARAQVPTNSLAWGHSFIYLPDKNRLILQTGDLELYSDDLGVTWTKLISPPRRHFTYLGDGKVLGRTTKEMLISTDYGVTWCPHGSVSPLPLYGSMGPILVDKDPVTGSVVRLAECITQQIRFSIDGGLTWPTVTNAPWSAETVLVRAGNGDIVAATRTSNRTGYIEVHGTNIPDPKTIPYEMWRVGGGYDFYCGFGVHISKDNGHTWSPINQLYTHGRFHASPVLMPNNDLVMTYVVRKGYDDTPEGLPQSGIEALVSYNHGQTWPLKHRYVLDKWLGEWEDLPGGKIKLMTPNETYTVLLNDGSLMTLFERGFQDADTKYCRILKLVHWRVDGAVPAAAVVPAVPAAVPAVPAAVQ